MLTIYGSPRSRTFRPLWMLHELDQALAGRDYPLGTHFIVADLNVASVLVCSRPAKLQLSGYRHLAGRSDRCLDRPARRQAQVA